MGAVTPGAGGGDALELDTDDVRRVAQELKGLGDQLMPALAAAMDGAGPERSVAAVAKVTASGDQFSALCGNYLRDSGEQLERVVQAFLAVEEHNAAAITSVDPRSM